MTLAGHRINVLSNQTSRLAWFAFAAFGRTLYTVADYAGHILSLRTLGTGRALKFTSILLAFAGGTERWVLPPAEVKALADTRVGRIASLRPDARRVIQITWNTIRHRVHVIASAVLGGSEGEGEGERVTVPDAAVAGEGHVAEISHLARCKVASNFADTLLWRVADQLEAIVRGSTDAATIFDCRIAPGAARTHSFVGTCDARTGVRCRDVERGAHCLPDLFTKFLSTWNASLTASVSPVVVKTP